MGGNYKGPSALAMAHRLRWLGARALERPESDPVRVLGLGWYDAARDFCAALAARYSEFGATLERVAGACAALSPQCSWLDQTRFLGPFLESVYAERDRETLPHPGFLRNRARARDILLGADPEETLSGPKVTAFYAGIMGDSSRVCVDRHAATLAIGERTRSLSDRLGAEIRAAYALAARWLEIAPRDLQSLLWCDFKARGAARKWEQPTLWEEAPRETLVSLALGWSENPERAFQAPESAPDSAAPLVPGYERAESERAESALESAPF